MVRATVGMQTTIMGGGAAAFPTLTPRRLRLRPSRASGPARSRACVTKAKYGDDNIFFDLKDIENTAGSWDMYADDKDTRYVEVQSEFFERAAKGLTRRESILGFVGLGGGTSLLVWGAKGASLAQLPITVGPKKAQPKPKPAEEEAPPPPAE